MKAEALSASLEDYLEAIYHIVQEKSAARPTDVSDRIGVSRSSVTSALHALSGKGLVNHAPYDIVTLTPKGERAALRVVHRHAVLLEFFANVLGVSPARAEESACEVEHTVSEEVLNRLAQFVDFIQIWPRLNIRWIEETGYFCERPESPEDCERCITSCLQSFLRGRAKDGETTH